MDGSFGNSSIVAVDGSFGNSSIVAGDGISGKYCNVLEENFNVLLIITVQIFVKMLRHLTLPSSHSLLGPV